MIKLSRRTFLKATAATTAGAAVSGLSNAELPKAPEIAPAPPVETPVDYLSDPTSCGGLRWVSPVDHVCDHHQPILRGTYTSFGALKDGFVLKAQWKEGDSLLLTAQTDPVENGIWVVRRDSWLRRYDCSEAFDGTNTVVMCESNNCVYIQTEQDAVIGKDPQKWFMLASNPESPDFLGEKIG